MELTENDKVLKNNIISLRKKYHVSQIALADKLGVGRDAIIKLENGTRRLSINELIKLSDFFKVPINDLIGISKTAEQRKYAIPIETDLSRMIMLATTYHDIPISSKDRERFAGYLDGYYANKY
ncbi:helix-turn-helix transcriptional regulator [Ligilactobacillus salivarius]|uniref:Transcriptional regulator n=1 Tax=Ligilactobacillus salivarius (strain UCC118) TaxID=362948 RepID=Q1WR53_LIGS1|nr:helix-turn-helix transcriptional regulator [Ligilactobacillus salivarius]ABE00645.1 Transcriptional regulator [Ligilactobacillus salivarius UCC118]EFK80081.1 DNA-binding helix-turn-helix protein [Ligilactobacillus salivarius ACS-116-V-Col5a]MDE1499289.1 helix-turn-helix transcriptional regulator [Ligilactobacillus salivarius]MDE1523688.1 helix-turn-helix transcriptional regulator [Ligilactobacillus salivarius]OQR18369.1 transcriptional regulator [Ligilactobacillus salivarius]